MGKFDAVLRLFPEPVTEVDPMEMYPAQPRRAHADRPWLMVNMISSADGAVEVGGVSEGLATAADGEVFGAVRACPDWILGAAQTARVERYGLPRPSARARDVRVAARRSERPRLAVVSGSLDFDLELPMFADRRDDEAPVLIITGGDADAGKVSALEDVAEVVQLDVAKPTPDLMLGELWRRGAQVVLCEGGPSLNAQFAAAGLIDELCLSIAPVIAGGDAKRIMQGAAGAVNEMELASVLVGDGTLIMRYLNK